MGAYDTNYVVISTGHQRYFDGLRAGILPIPTVRPFKGRGKISLRLMVSFYHKTLKIARRITFWLTVEIKIYFCTVCLPGIVHFFALTQMKFIL